MEIERVSGDIREEKAHIDRPAAIEFMIVEHTAPIFKTADSRHTQNARIAARKGNVPPVLLGPIEVKRASLYVRFRIADFKLADIGFSFPERVNGQRAVVVDPGMRVDEPLRQQPKVGSPTSELEIEVVPMWIGCGSRSLRTHGKGANADAGSGEQ